MYKNYQNVENMILPGNKVIVFCRINLCSGHHDPVLPSGSEYKKVSSKSVTGEGRLQNRASLKITIFVVRRVNCLFSYLDQLKGWSGAYLLAAVASPASSSSLFRMGVAAASDRIEHECDFFLRKHASFIGAHRQVSSSLHSQSRVLSLSLFKSINTWHLNRQEAATFFFASLCDDGELIEFQGQFRIYSIESDSLNCWPERSGGREEVVFDNRLQQQLFGSMNDWIRS